MAFALLGMLGFVATCAATMLGALDVATHLELCVVALASYALGLGGSYIGDPEVTRPARPTGSPQRSRAVEAELERQSLQMPRSS